MNEAKVFVVDDDLSVCDSISELLEIAGYTVETFQSAEEFLEICTPDTYGCIILDVNMPGMDGPKLQMELARRKLLLPIIFLSGQGTIPLTVRTIKAGAMDFLTKPVKSSILLTRVQEAMEQLSVLRKRTEVSQFIAGRMALLTERESDVMQLAVAGYTNKEIAQRLGISHRTVEIHRSRIMQKTGAPNVLELARLCSSYVKNK
ncbi:transcriptional regulatory protein TdiR [mine drainage metagenome]|uniref:Transcriptional regulatory protein TdiR n=1 Tax=mine drainage metagenome TaxID=410659 RepID=A0A1J5RZG0_9ZZZZ